ncbi:hypothetical protein B1813_06320 [Saccharomonospora piscinae]|uniref:Uncharacterized protein n=1 Tax=Saccharomonospora piscinae TaxID=687388 RepID=A0A1V9AAF6_SACPI|nr:hypothetical protein [Saccharomonospora piscinae]OQO94109.1 hypothetical protein B1813_06320 [Saccharomonospora piscinae]TLW95287.1 hypothetical protein FFT09_05470 [Saccharomonospora piscinae]
MHAETDPAPRPVPGPPPGHAPAGADARAAIDQAVAGLDGLDELTPAEHVERFDAVHTALAVALSSIDKV